MANNIIKKSILFILILSAFRAVSQEKKVARYYFDGDLNSLSGDFPALKPEGALGEYTNEVVEKFGRLPRSVYAFPQSSGLTFDNSKAPGFITGDYAIEMFFRYDDGQLLLYNQLLGSELDNNQGKYVHLVVTRNHQTKEVLVYLNGKKTLGFPDANDDLEMAQDREITFFAQEEVQTTAGAVSMIKIYNYFINEEISDELFESFATSTTGRFNGTEVGEKLKLDKLYFVQSETLLLPESLPTLDQVADFINSKPQIKIEIQGHTDNQGDYYKNIELSKQRAEEIKKYLISSGIMEDRLQTRGFGGTRPIESNYSEITRKLNRRVELEVIN